VVDLTWNMGPVEESLLKRLYQASCFSIMANECINVATMEKMSVFCQWEEDGVLEEHFLEIIHLKKADTEEHLFCSCVTSER